jgi:hypothetical protein
MPIVHPQIHKACDLMPLISAASTENDDICELTKPVVTALIDGEFFTMLKTESVGGMELKPVNRQPECHLAGRASADQTHRRNEDIPMPQVKRHIS